MKTYGKVDVLIQVFLPLSLVAGEWSALCPCRFTPSPRYLLDRFGGSQSCCGQYGEVKILAATGSKPVASSFTD
jgi:hypothetical protein